MLWYVLNGLYLIIWSALLIHCLFRREFYPIFGLKWGTKVLWLLTFVFFNPFLTLIYFVFGFLLGPPKTEEQRKSVGFGSAAAIACIGVIVVLFEWPFSGYRAEPVVILSETGGEKPAEQNESLYGFEVRVGTMGAKNGVQTWSSTSAGGGARVSTHNILLICQHPHRLLDHATREFQKSLIQLPYVDKVTYYPFGTWPKPGELLPDVFITINMPEVNENNFLCGRKLKVAITWKTNSIMFAGPSHSVNAYTPPLVKFDIESRLDHESRMMGIESPRAKYKLEASNISREMIKSVSKQFESLLDKHNRLPELPEMLHGTYHEPPEFSFLKDDMNERLISGRGLFKNNHTVWRFADEREIDEALTAYRDELKTLGWAVENSTKEYLRMQKDSEYIYIFRQRRRDPETRSIMYSNREKKTSQVPMIAHYESYLTNDQMQRAMDALLDSDVDMKTLLVFEKYFRTPQQRERLRSIIEQSPVHTLDGCLVLARYWSDRGELDKGRELLLRARAMQRAEKEHNVKAQEIKSLAKKLGDEGLAEVSIDEKILHDMGFVNIEQLTEPLEIERALDEPVLFSRRLDSGELRTFALRVIRSREPSSPVPYRLLTVEKSKGSSRSSETGGRIEPDGVWIAESDLYDLASENKPPQLKIECLGNEHFLFAVTP
ncbi:MAG: PLD nuclease N-terminal domain-containing protein [Planctomycetota bacterium]|jgi:hypothetical protein